MSRKSSVADETTEETTTLTKASDVAESWQWDGSHNPSVPEWLAGCHVHVMGSHLKVNAPQGAISAIKDEWVVKDSEGNIYVTK